MPSINTLLKMGGLGSSGVTWLAHWRFTTATPAQLTTYTEGQGTLTFTDSLSTMSIAGGELLPNAKSTGVRDPWTRDAAGYARTIGRMFIGVFKRTSLSLVSQANEPMFSWLTTLTTPTDSHAYGLVAPGSTFAGWLAVTLGGFTTLLDMYSGANQYTVIAVILRNPGYFIIIDGKLAHVGNTGTQATLYPSLMARSANAEPGGLDEAGVVDVGTYIPAYSTQYGIATSRAASPTTGDTFVTLADTVIEFTWVAAAGETLNIMFRRTDDNNTYLVRCDHSGGGGDNTIKVIEVNGGVETSKNSAAQTFTNASTYRVVVIADGAMIKTAINDVAKNTYNSATFNQTVAGGKVTGFSNVSANVVAYPRVVPSLAAFGMPTALVNAWCYGDSVTQGSGDDGVLGTNGYPIYLSSLPSTVIHPSPAKIGISGMNIATAQARIDSDIAATTANPDVIFIALGRNDVKSGAAAPVQATVESNLGYILDACHTKWPAARCYLERPQTIGDNGYRDVFCDTWIPNVLSTRSSWAFLGADSRTFLNAGNMADTLHPNHAGHLLLAAAMRSAAGY